MGIVLRLMSIDEDCFSLDKGRRLIGEDHSLVDTDCSSVDEDCLLLA